MITSKQALARYGSPVHEAGMVIWDVPAELEIGVIPKRIYCNRDLVLPLTRAFTNLIERKYVRELVTWDGCFNIRQKRNGTSASLHSWGLAIDVNAAWNQLGKKPQLTPGFVKCFTDAGFEWGGDWDMPDGMHMQLAEFPK
jgi:hypothetical protein